MRQSHNRQAPFAVALGGACLFSLGIVGCAREAGLELAKDAAVTERANSSILRSRQELAAVDGKSPSKSLAEPQPEVDERPSLASRWKAPFKSAGSLMKPKKSDEVVEDPFLADRKNQPAASGKEALASAAKPAATDSKSATPASGEKKLAMAEPSATGKPAAEGPRPKSVMSSDAQAALDAFLKSQEPVGVSDRALAASHESSSVIRKPGTGAASGPSARSSDAAATADIVPEDSAVLTSRPGVKSGQARPFPPATEAGVPDEDPKALAAARKGTSSTSARNPLAAAPAGVRRNPLLENTEEPVETAPPARTRQATGREIAALLKKAKAAGENGEFEQAYSYATAASELAEKCSYEFAAREPSPERVVAWLESKQATQSSEEELAPAKPERRAIAATRRPSRDVAAMTTGFEKPNAEQVFADEVEASLVAQAPERESSFQEFAAGVGKTPAAPESSPNWPVLTPRELAASDELWQPSRTEFQQSWTDLRTNSAPGREPRPSETRLASAESNAPAFVATAQAEHSSPVLVAARSGDPIVQLGEPTDLAPGAEAVVASASHRRGPRLASPPPLSIEDAGTDRAAVTPKRGSRHARTIWFAVVGALSVVVLVVFRRWAYRNPVV